MLAPEVLGRTRARNSIPSNASRSPSKMILSGSQVRNWQLVLMCSQVPLADYPTIQSGSSDRSGRSGRSGLSRTSGASRLSVDSAATINSVHSLKSLVRHISADLYPQETLVATLRTWLAAVDPAAYAQERPWRPEVLAAYNEYKRRAAEHGTAHTAFRDYMNVTRRNTPPEQHLERARLALAWGEAAVRCVIPMLSPATAICLLPVRCRTEHG